MPKKKLPNKNVRGAFEMPVTFNIDRTILSAAPLSSIHFPIIDAMAIRIPICLQVLPNSSAILSPMCLPDICFAASGVDPLLMANCSIAEPGVISDTTKAPSNSARKGCSFSPIIPPTTMSTPMNNIKIGSAIKGAELMQF
jgi:hypothetical protein